MLVGLSLRVVIVFIITPSPADQRNTTGPKSQLIVLILGSELSDNLRKVIDLNKGFSLTYQRSECRYVYEGGIKRGQH